MDVKLIQQKIPINNLVCFTLKSGEKKSGILTEISKSHVTLENNGNLTIILLEMIGAFDTPTDFLDKQSEVKHEQNPSYEHILQKLLEIKNSFDAYIKATKLEFTPPDFNLPNDMNLSDFIQKTWGQIKSKFEYAKKINELSEKFGRIQPIISSLRSLTERLPDSAFFKRHLGYLYFLAYKYTEAFNCLKDSAHSSDEPNDWYNFAVISIFVNKEDYACYGLERYFHKKLIAEDFNVWYVFTKFLIKFNYYSALQKLLHNPIRKLLDTEQQKILETAIYCLQINERKSDAEDIVKRWIITQQPLKDLILQALTCLSNDIPNNLLAIENDFKHLNKPKIAHQETKKPHQINGHIQTYIKDKGFGFLLDSDGIKYFFHRSALIDETLQEVLNKFVSGNKIEVVFEVAQNPTGSGNIAVKISQIYSVDTLFTKAKEYANEGEYAKAISYIRRVLTIAPDYKYAQEYLEKWKAYALLISVPKGSNPYARAKRAQLIEKDLEKAIDLFKESIKKKDNLESAVKDLAMLYIQLNKNQEAISLLKQNQSIFKNIHSFEDMLITAYQKAEKYIDAIDLLQKRLNSTTKKDLKEQLFWQFANLYFRAKDYKNAESSFKQVLKLNPDHVPAQRNLAVCLSKQGKYNDAKELLNRIIEKYSDSKAAEILELLQQAQSTGPKVEEIIIESEISYFSIELSSFAKFFLARCEFENTNRERIKESKYNGSEKDAEKDVRKLEELATEHGTRRPRGRSQCYLEAAKVILDIDGDRSLFYRYLCRSFTSKGDAAVIENKSLDSIRNWYVEALKAYDGCSSKHTHFDEQDAVNALTRYLFSLIGHSEIPTISPKSKSEDKEIVLKKQLEYIDNAIESVILSHPNREKVFDAILILVLNSRYVAKRIFKSIYFKRTLHITALEYLKNRGAYIPSSINKLEDFLTLWNDLQRSKLDELRGLYNELKLLNNFDLTTGWLSDYSERLNNLDSKLLSDIDNERIRQIRIIFGNCIELCKQISFEEQERLCMQIDNRCQDFLSDIESNPTQMSLEYIYNIIKIIKERISNKLDNLYETSKPQIEIQLPIESYFPDNNQQVELQITISNKVGRSPAESVEIIIQPDEDYFSLIESEVKIMESIGGDKQKTLKIPLQVTDFALQAKTFPIGIYVQYQTRSLEIEQTPVNSFSIRLYPEDEFEEIDNPYVLYAEGGIVSNPEMFYGREELIKNITDVIKKSHNQNKSIIVYGQKRAGKSSILFHLKNILQQEKNILVIDLGNIGSLLDLHSSVPLLYQILWSILNKFKNATEDLIEKNGYHSLNLIFPKDIDFYQHPAPLSLFKDIFEKFIRQQSKHNEWSDIHLLLLIDEFSYIHNLIISGKIPDTFMKNWKALLQENFFSCVLAGQDVMPKFKQQFPNEFGTSQDERVTYLKQDDAVRLIDKPIRIDGRNGKSRYRGKAIQRILDLTAGSPFYIQILCNHLVEYMNRKRAGLITEADVEQVKNELIKGANALDISKFDNLINSGDTSQDAIIDDDTLKVLKDIAVNSKTGLCHKDNISCNTLSSIDRILEDLVKRDIIEREREYFYQIKVGIFKEWLITNK